MMIMMMMIEVGEIHNKTFEIPSLSTDLCLLSF